MYGLTYNFNMNIGEAVIRSAPMIKVDKDEARGLWAANRGDTGERSTICF